MVHNIHASILITTRVNSIELMELTWELTHQIATDSMGLVDLQISTELQPVSDTQIPLNIL